MTKRWFGFRAFTPGTIDLVTGLWTADFDFDFVIMNDGDTILRLLVGYRFETDLIENSLMGTLSPWPWYVSVTKTPTPDGETEFDVRSVGGDAMFRDYLRWTPQPWTDGTTFSTKWYAHSDGMASMQGERMIFDKTFDKLTVALGAEAGGFPGWDSDNYVFVPVQGWVWVEAMVLNKSS